MPSAAQDKYRELITAAKAEGVILHVQQYIEPRREPPPHPEYRLVHATGDGIRGPFAVLPVLRNRRGAQPTGKGLTIVDFDGSAFVVVSHAWVDQQHYSGIFATLFFEDGYYLLDPDAGDTGAFDSTRGTLLPAAAASVASAAEPESPAKGRLVPSARIADDSDSDTAEPPQPSTKRKRKSRAVAEVLIAAASATQ